MSQKKSTARKDLLRSELEASRVAWHTLLDSLSDTDLKKKSHNATWTNKHIVVHMAMGFFILGNAQLPRSNLSGGGLLFPTNCATRL
jgi:hypothetical protein